ncbi:secretory phospholipase A2 [Eremomyces bilateralis CBS 781.70]|uniref:Secretory phospholipase A2 n=1 Tax=Eremomyces bilateralis CBS 781.70 TaxID=1392243 RepID=A0A6G1G4J6_9PEZI|nr:secretory phospholipase A2 [Eremomyces bilateralis CBS 781.70]KAF1812836.1 secretory phospholipase A2 [Eremomyces bilateralis CBS 781.70]
MMFFVSLITLILAVSAISILEPRQSCSKALADEYIFTLTLSAFLLVRASQTPSCFDWTSNNCTVAPDNPFGYPFKHACQRHDFGYRNYKKLDVFTEPNRLRLDDKFKEDLYDICGDDAGCTGLADVYYGAVRVCGDGNCFDIEDEAV